MAGPGLLASPPFFTALSLLKWRRSTRLSSLFTACACVAASPASSWSRTPAALKSSSAAGTRNFAALEWLGLPMEASILPFHLATREQVYSLRSTHIQVASHTHSLPSRALTRMCAACPAGKLPTIRVLWPISRVRRASGLWVRRFRLRQKEKRSASEPHHNFRLQCGQSARLQSECNSVFNPALVRLKRRERAYF